jgi:hypothetical protein
MLDHKRPQAIQLMRPKSMGFRDANGVEPELRDVIPVLDMNVRWLRSFETIEEEAKTRGPQDSRHRALSIHKIRFCLAHFNGVSPRRTL